MWRTIRKVVGRPGNSSLRLGQIQAAEKNEEANNNSNEDKEKALNHRGRVFLASEALAPADCGEGSGVNLGFDLVKNIFQKLQKDEKRRALTFSILIAREKKEDHSNPFVGELKSWWGGVLALSSILACRKFVSDEKSPWHIDFKDAPGRVLLRLLTSRPQAALGVLPPSESPEIHTGTAKPTDSLDEAIASFQSSFSECTAATQNKLGIKFAALKQHQKAFWLFTQASERGHPLAQFNLGLCYENAKGVERDLSKAAECYKGAAAHGQGGAMYNLALFYMEGIGGLPQDQPKAIELLEDAAQTGLCKAQSFLGLYYADESSSHCDYEKAIPYLQLAAAKNDPLAEYHLGICFERGLGIERDMPKAAYLYQVAADHGHTGAQFNVGVFYEHGLGGCSVDKHEACRYYRMAAEAGDEDAMYNLLLLRKQMEAEKQSRQPSFAVGQQNLMFSFLKELMGPLRIHGQHPDSHGLARRASSPGILDEIASEGLMDHQASSSNAPEGSKPLLAF